MEGEGTETQDEATSGNEGKPPLISPGDGLVHAHNAHKHERQVTDCVPKLGNVRRDNIITFTCCEEEWWKGKNGERVIQWV